MRLWYNFIIADTPKTKEVLHGSHGWADVRDIAEAHVRGLEKDVLGGERILVHEGPFIWQEFSEWTDLRSLFEDQKHPDGTFAVVDIVQDLAPSTWPRHNIPKGFPLENSVYKIRFNQEKQEKLLGLRFRTKEETTKDILEDFSKRGW